MHTLYGSRLAACTCAALGILWPAAPGLGTPIWFDETNGAAGYGTFHDLAGAYQDFIGAPEGTIGFDDLKEGVKLANQYFKSDGVSFKHTSGGSNSSSSGVRSEGGAVTEDLTGYDGSYRPHGNKVYVKFDNDREQQPFGIWFNQPVSMVGAFLGMGYQGDVHALSISLFDDSDTLLATRTIQSWLWEGTTKRQNYETFFAVSTDAPLISRVEIRNLAQVNYANALILDDLAWTSTFVQSMTLAIPEPTTLLLAATGVALLLLRRRTQNA